VTDVFAVQDEIAAAVVGALKLKLLPPAVARAGRTESVAAHDLYLRGLYLWNLRTGESLLRASEFFERAIQADPGYALAHAGLADAIEVRSGYVWVWNEPLQAKARAAALRALELDSGLGEAHASLGNMLADRFEYAAAIEHFRKAIALRPDYATAHQWYASVLATLGRHDEARKEVELALQLDPTSRVIGQNAAWDAMLARDYPRAERHLRTTLDLAPDFETARTLLAVLYAYQGRRAEALAELGKLKPAEENLDTRAIVHALVGSRLEAERLAGELEQLSRKKYVPNAVLAPVWAALGDREKTFASLRRLCRDRDGAWGVWPKVDPVFDAVRSDPRFGEVLACLNFQ
jgi:serine/threonine-protein kinase